MIGALLLVVVLVVVLPSLVLVTGAAVSAVLGWALKDEADRRYEGSELLDLNR